MKDNNMNMRESIPASTATTEAVHGGQYVVVPETTLPNGLVVQSFLVGQYYCSKGDDDKAVITTEGAPWVRINYHEARAACAAIGGALIAETQALALAWNIYNVAENWSSGDVGVGTLLQGLHRGTVFSAQAGTYQAEDNVQRRGFKLSNGETVYDVAGNVYGWTFDNVQGDENGLIARSFDEDSPSVATSPLPRLTQGVGWFPAAGADWSCYALVRGGCWGSEADAGVFGLSGGWPDLRFDYVGFRCTKPIGL
jgi:formylglycine-generating enzyme required for sulfatase activity